MWQVTGCPWAVVKSVSYTHLQGAGPVFRVPSCQGEAVWMASDRDGLANKPECGPWGSNGFQPGQPYPYSLESSFLGQGCAYGVFDECSSHCHTANSWKTPPSSYHRLGMLIGHALPGWAGPHKATFRGRMLQESEVRPARRKSQGNRDVREVACRFRTLG